MALGKAQKMKQFSCLLKHEASQHLLLGSLTLETKPDTSCSSDAISTSGLRGRREWGRGVYVLVPDSWLV